MGIKDAILSLFFPQECACCGRYIKDFKYEYICGECYIKIKPAGKDICRICGIPFCGKELCPECQKEKRSFSFLRSAGIYEGGLKSLIHALKFEGKLKGAKIIAEYMAANIHLDLSKAVIVPVPVSDKTRKIRGYNQSEQIAKNISHITGAEVKNLLIKTRETLPQRDLDKKERKENVKGVFAVKNKVGGKIFIIDDVATTCATLDEASKVILKAGAEEVICITAARAI